MRLIDLDPTWLVHNGDRVGFTFISPVNPKVRQSCVAEFMPHDEQYELIASLHGENAIVQQCSPEARWMILGGIENADFETMSVQPSIDGSNGGLWHGYITDGVIVGGLKH